VESLWAAAMPKRPWRPGQLPLAPRDCSAMMAFLWASGGEKSPWQQNPALRAHDQAGAAG
jgi:hypothetical protein